MFCSQCAHNLTPSDVYCPKCAKPVASFNFDPGQAPQVEYIGETETVVRSKVVAVKKTSPWWYIGGTAAGIAGILVLLGAVASVAFVVLIAPQLNKTSDPSPPVNRASRNTDPDRATASTPTPDVPTPEPEKPKTKLLDSIVPIGAGQIVDFAFETESSARITGGFVTYGGSKDIDTYIVDESNYFALKGDGGFRFVYGRPKAEKAKIDVQVPAGRWHVVFSNRHAWLTPKEVAAEIYYQEQ